MLKRKVKLLSKLSEDYPTSCKKLSEIMLVSERTIRYDIKELNSVGKKNGFYIVSYPHYGYQLEVINRDLLNDFKKDNKINEIPVEDDDKVSYIASRIILSKLGLSLKQIQDILFISPSGAKKLIKETEKLFKENKIKLVLTKGFYKAEADEKEIREFIYILLIKYKISRYYRNYNVLANKNIRKEIYKILKTYGISLPEVSYNNFLIYLFTDLTRVENGNNLVNKKIDFAGNIKIKEAIVLINKYIKELTNTSLNENEINILCYRLLGLQMNHPVRIDDKLVKNISDLVRECINEVDKKYNTRFINDSELDKQLINHCITLSYRLKYNTLIDNQLKNEIFISYPLAANYARVFAKDFQSEYKNKCNDVEISYLAIIFQSAIERQVPDKKFNVLLISESTNGMVNHLKDQINSIFSKYINQIVTIDDVSYRDNDLTSFDVIFTTTDAAIKNQPRAVKLKLLMDEKQIQKIRDTFNTLT